MEFADSQIATFLHQYLLPLFRLSAMFMVMPIIASRIVAARVRLAIALLVTMLIVPIIPDSPPIDSLSMQSFLFILQEVAIGTMIGFLFQIVFQVFVLSGQFMAMKMGLGFASMNDPTNGVQTTALSQFFLMLMTVVFVSVNGHVILIDILVSSFESLPPGKWVLQPSAFYTLVSLATWMFSAALVFALPVLTSLLFVNIAFGVMSRAAPQLNIFAVGFPFTLLMGLVLIYLGIGNFLDAFENVVAHGVFSAKSLLGLR